jgi:hypothetical protein
MKTKNIDLSMVHFGIADKDGEILINTDLLVKKGIYNDVVSFIIDGYEPDIQQDAIIYANKIENSTKSELIEIKELMNERLRLCILREDKKYIDLYDSLIRTVEERILNLPDVEEEHKQLSIPEELDTPEARKIFDKAIQAGFMNPDYSFNGNGNQLALFAGLASDTLGLTTTQWRGEKRIKVRSWEPFKQLFGKNDYANRWKNINTYSIKVKDADKIKKIFS